MPSVHTSSVSYAILSHTWSRAGEQTYQDVLQLQRDVQQFWAEHIPTETDSADFIVLKHPRLSAKVQRACAVAVEDGYEWLWIDACCIDKLNGPEQTESINSMFEWYHAAQLCYAYLEDVNDSDILDAPSSQFRRARWHTRGWTLQELIAPRSLVFLASNWIRIGKKSQLALLLEEITGVERNVLTGEAPLSTVKISQRMRWAKGRQTERSEDGAYALMGIFGVYMPVIYGEGFSHAFRRLERAIKTAFAESRKHCAATFDDLDPRVFDQLEEEVESARKHQPRCDIQTGNENPLHVHDSPAGSSGEVDRDTTPKQLIEHTTLTTLNRPLSPAASAVSSTTTLSSAELEHRAQLQRKLDGSAKRHERFATALQNLDPTSEVLSLKERIQDIQVGFRDLSISLGHLDNKLNRRKFKFLRHIGSKGLRPRWDPFQEASAQFKTLLNQSQLIAMDTAVVLKQNLHIFTDEHVQDAKKVGALKQEIENFMTIIEWNMHRTSKICEKLSRLSDDIRLVGQEIGEKVERAQQHNEDLSVGLAEAHYQLQNLGIGLQSITEELSDSSPACNIPSLTTGGTPSGLSSVNSNFSRTAVGSILDVLPQSVLSAANKWTEAARLRMQIQGTREKISDLRNIHGAVNDFMALLQDTNSQIANLALNIGALSNIWRYIKSDMVELRSLLGTVVGGRYTELLLHKLTITRKVYEKLVVALEEYSKETLL
ncbi:hypothetical protein ONZ51_g12337 [Trametes cubensis]|uniref:Heterokaryon incompatibility domain-containing protein n=1 Tax=Trametes cubensis TaxID=1111947 RepID=A0AAD7THE7_9APHY|nr:hypothetical protein ONZ51_g12337 [Trametes cubensis]